MHVLLDVVYARAVEAMGHLPENLYSKKFIVRNDLCGPNNTRITIGTISFLPTRRLSNLATAKETFGDFQALQKLFVWLSIFPSCTYGVAFQRTVLAD